MEKVKAYLQSIEQSDRKKLLSDLHTARNDIKFVDSGSKKVFVNFIQALDDDIHEMKKRKLEVIVPEAAPTEKTIGCGKCSNVGKLESCPYSSELYNEENECDCCDDCRYQCAMDI